MIDVSDGLALDLHRLADVSGVGFTLDSVPVAEGAIQEDALGGGEDYELVVVIGAGLADACARTWAGAAHPTADRRRRRLPPRTGLQATPHP
jgi:thiamine monophosphate kinase